jgi:hypothetical protein
MKKVKIIISAAFSLLLTFHVNAEPVDQARAKACEDYVTRNSVATNKYNGQKYDKFTWWSIYETQGMWQRPQFGQNYLLRFRVQMLNEKGSRVGSAVSYYCVSDFKTKKVIGFEVDPVQ